MTPNNFKPILFNTEMVQAILAGRKTQTRRIVKLDTGQLIADTVEQISSNYFFFKKDNEAVAGRSPKYQIGNILWVRETFKDVSHNLETEFSFLHKADFLGDTSEIVKWTPSIHMPKEAARIFLKVTNVRCERLQDISEEDAIAEGIRIVGDFKGIDLYHNYKFSKGYHTCPKLSFCTLWDSINAKKNPWSSNPWVWVYDFERIEKPENFI